ncbi:Crp/Fnr family transcriptional regulator [Portibacter lacus]|uniref:cAMP-binding protein n=2 Tax=Bacteroidota TaxID=976 RepID=A0AA37SU61_9BACT|nr:Crp/Fnr family transcriptional regulator [Portibacter lacus]GLR18228.1 cAMP-binding protein [Portibacter lacus]
MEKFKEYINPFDKMIPEEWDIIKTMAELKVLKKEDSLIQQNAFFEKEVFIEKGIIRAYIIDDDGNEKSIAFYEEGKFMSTSTLRTLNGRSLHHYQAMCKTELILFNSNELKSFFSNNNFLSEIGKTIKEGEIKRQNNRDNCLLQVKGRDKYLNFIKHYPNIELHISQKHIASYLGITPISLSRIKSNLRKM